MRVFDANFRKKAEKKLRSFANNDSIGPLTYRIAIEPQYADLRNRIEDWVKLLPDGKVKKDTVGKLRSEENFSNIFNTLKVGDMLRHLGYEAEYEHAFIPRTGSQIKTPDWTVYESGKREEGPRFIVEVFSANPIEKRDEEQAKWAAVCKRLEGKISGYGLILSSGIECCHPESAARTRIVRIITDWLKSEPSVDESKAFTCDTLEEVDRAFPPVKNIFQVKVCECHTKKAWCWWNPVLLFEIKPDAIKAGIQDKVNSYKNLMSDIQIPFVVAVVPNPDALYRHGTILDVLYGSDATQLYARDSETLTPKFRDIRLLDGLFRGARPINPILSAVWWVNIEYLEEMNLSTMLVFRNYEDNAENPLPADVLSPEQMSKLSERLIPEYQTGKII
ncbi:MAG: hypothetical protein JW966_00145 [Anaerolineae bacterium]|nr:hypothetical protein [Anaerolineae bacterium]